MWLSHLDRHYFSTRLLTTCSHAAVIERVCLASVARMNLNRTVEFRPNVMLGSTNLGSASLEEQVFKAKRAWNIRSDTLNKTLTGHVQSASRRPLRHHSIRYARTVSSVSAAEISASEQQHRGFWIPVLLIGVLIRGPSHAPIAIIHYHPSSTPVSVMSFQASRRGRRHLLIVSNRANVTYEGSSSMIS